jgi:hypothetical protein
MGVTLATDTSKLKGRSRVTNGKLPHGVDGRTRAARRRKDVLDALVIEHSIDTESDFLLAQSAAAKAAWLDEIVAREARGEPVDDEMVVRKQNSLRRDLDRLKASAKARRRDQRGRP